MHADDVRERQQLAGCAWRPAMPAMRATARTSPFGTSPDAQRGDDDRAADHAPDGGGGADGRLLGGDVDHPGVPGGVEVRELVGHGLTLRTVMRSPTDDLVDLGGDDGETLGQGEPGDEVRAGAARGAHERDAGRGRPSAPA